MSQAVDRLTLREKLREAARCVREMAEHLELGFGPKVHELRRLTRQQDPSSGAMPVADITIRNNVSSVLESESFTAGLNETLEYCLKSIQNDVSEVVNRGLSR